jgi:membrane-bound lytic murein transglycosylase D
MTTTIWPTHASTVRPSAPWGRCLGLFLLLNLQGCGAEDPRGPEADADVKVDLPAVPVTLPVEMNARVERWMDRFRTDQRASFERFLAREGLYGSLIRAKLRDRGMPEELIYLAMIESGLSPRATSPVSAAGVWQFMGPTAREYGLRVDRWVDERRDPVKATDAALDYLEWLHDRYDSWYLAAAAYNAGFGRVDRILRTHADGRKGDEAIYWEIIEHLPRETREYVPRLLAATTLARQAFREGFEVTPYSPYEYDRVWVPGNTPLAAVARSLDVPADLMGDLNPHLIRGVTPPGTSYGLRVPVGATGDVMASLGARSYQTD